MARGFGARESRAFIQRPDDEKRTRAYEAEGMTRSDAQSIVEAENKVMYVRDKFLKNEGENSHSENVVLMAESVGTKDDVEQANAILELHMKKGELTPELKQEREELYDKLVGKFNQYIETAPDQGMDSKQKRVAAMAAREFNRIEARNQTIADRKAEFRKDFLGAIDKESKKALAFFGASEQGIKDMVSEIKERIKDGELTDNKPGDYAGSMKEIAEEAIRTIFPVKGVEAKEKALNEFLDAKFKASRGMRFVNEAINNYNKYDKTATIKDEKGRDVVVYKNGGMTADGLKRIENYVDKVIGSVPKGARQFVDRRVETANIVNKIVNKLDK